MRKACTIDGCSRPMNARGLCSAHYIMWKKHGDPLWADKGLHIATLGARKNTVADFWKKVERGTGCWNWTKGKDDDGYGVFSWQGNLIKAHRFSWELYHRRSVPDGLCVLHTCDNPSCVRPTHLFVGTQADNGKDRDQKGRGLAGTKQSPQHVINRMQSRLKNGKKYSPETIAKMSLAKIGKRASDETRKKMSDMRQGVPRPGLIGVLAGERNPRAVLTRDDVARMRELYQGGRSKQSLSVEFGIGWSQVARIVNGKSWK